MEFKETFAVKSAKTTMPTPQVGLLAVMLACGCDILSQLPNDDSGVEDTKVHDTKSTNDTFLPDDTNQPVDTADTGREELTASYNINGEAIVDESGYNGCEEWSFVANQGVEDELCVINFDLNSIAEASDCPYCDWAYELQISNPQILRETAPGCAALGYDAEAIAALAGTTFCGGYNSDYYGHAKVLLKNQDCTGDGWQVAGFASEQDGVFTYAYEENQVRYE